MFCSNCGNEVSEKAVICVKCGVALKGENPLATTAGVGDKDWLTTLLLCLFLGWLGIHRFYTKDTVFGVIQLLTFGVFGIWTLIDLIMIITGSYTYENGKKLVKR
jgi:hypothetical protein